MLLTCYYCYSAGSYLVYRRAQPVRGCLGGRDALHIATYQGTTVYYYETALCSGLSQYQHVLVEHVIFEDGRWTQYKSTSTDYYDTTVVLYTLHVTAVSRVTHHTILHSVFAFSRPLQRHSQRETSIIVWWQYHRVSTQYTQH